MARQTRPGVIRIIGGRWKRTPLQVVDAPGLRPTPDRVRETLFNWLDNEFKHSFASISVLDLFAGTGALGLEAASRGAAPVVLVERDAAAATTLRAQVVRLEASIDVQVEHSDAKSVINRMRAEKRSFQLVLLDPPFDAVAPMSIVHDVLPLCASHLYVEAAHPLDETALDALGLTIRRHGKAGAVFYHLLRRKNNEETVDASRYLSGDI